MGQRYIKISNINIGILKCDFSCAFIQSSHVAWNTIWLKPIIRIKCYKYSLPFDIFSRTTCWICNGARPSQWNRQNSSKWLYMISVNSLKNIYLSKQQSLVFTVYVHFELKSLNNVITLGYCLINMQYLILQFPKPLSIGQ